jgi:TRAP-type uncharacterized transport system substrate-binding protein
MTTQHDAPRGRAPRWVGGKLLYSVGFGLALFLVSLALFHFSDFLKPKPDVVRIAYSAGGPVRKHYLEQMAAHGRKWNLDIRLVPSEDTDATLTMIDSQSADLALIAGAVEDRASRRVLEVMPLYMEPLQLVVKAPLYEAVSHDFSQLKGKSISMDHADSATSVLATELLRFIGLTDPATGALQYREAHMPQSQLMAQTDSAALPDAIFQIGGVPSATIENLVTRHDYRLVALPFGGAFNLSKFRESEAPKSAKGPRLGLNKTFVEEAVIPAYVYSVLPPVPAVDIRTIAARLMLVGGAHLKNGVVQRVLGLVLSPEISHLVEPQLTVKLLDSEFQFERHPGTDAYLASLKPLDVDGAVSGYQRMAEIWGILVALYLAVTNGWTWWKAKRDRKPKHSVGVFLSQVLEVEAIELHLEGRLEDSEHLQSLLAALADTRSQLRGGAT